MKQHRKKLAVGLPDWGDERDAPPVDENLLRAFHENRASEEERRTVAWLIFRYYSWARADVRLLMQQEGRLPPDPQS